MLAHPGGLADDGCHYCRTNCDEWGEVEGARHCHGGSDDYGGSTNEVYESIPSCPLFSSYNSFSKQCECYSGYVADNGQCVDQDEFCSDNFGIYSEYDSFSEECVCMSGYYFDGSECIEEEEEEAEEEFVDDYTYEVDDEYVEPVAAVESTEYEDETTTSESNSDGSWTILALLGGGYLGYQALKGKKTEPPSELLE